MTVPTMLPTARLRFSEPLLSYGVSLAVPMLLVELGTVTTAVIVGTTLNGDEVASKEDTNGTAGTTCPTTSFTHTESVPADVKGEVMTARTATVFEQVSPEVVLDVNERTFQQLSYVGCVRKSLDYDFSIPAHDRHRDVDGTRGRDGDGMCGRNGRVGYAVRLLSRSSRSGGLRGVDVREIQLRGADMDYWLRRELFNESFVGTFKLNEMRIICPFALPLHSQVQYTSLLLPLLPLIFFFTLSPLFYLLPRFLPAHHHLPLSQHLPRLLREQLCEEIRQKAIHPLPRLIPQLLLFRFLVRRGKVPAIRQYEEHIFQVFGHGFFLSSLLARDI
jgi:hypothetical protein